MRFKVDENLPVQFAEALVSAGHDAMTVLDKGLNGAPENTVFEACQIEERALMSLDLDFSDIRRYPPGNSSGILVFRTRSQDRDHLLGILQEILPLLEDEHLARSLWIVEEDRIRIRTESES